MQTRSQTKAYAILGIQSKPITEVNINEGINPAINIDNTTQYSTIHAKIYPELPEFDFDESSAAWRANKSSIGHGSFVYICEYFSIMGKKCTAKVAPTSDIFCRKHTKT